MFTLFPFLGAFVIFGAFYCFAADVDDPSSQAGAIEKVISSTDCSKTKTSLHEQDLKEQMKVFRHLARRYHGEGFDPAQTHIPKLRSTLKKMHVYALELCQHSLREKEAFHIGKLIRQETSRLSKMQATMSLYVSSALRYALLIDFANDLYLDRYNNIKDEDWLFKNHGTKSFDHNLQENLFPQKMLELADYPFNFYGIFLHPSGILPEDFFVKSYQTKPLLTLAALGKHDIKADHLFGGSYAFLVHDMQVHQLLLMDLCRQISMQLTPFSPRFQLTLKNHDRIADGFFILQNYIIDTVERYKGTDKKGLLDIYARIFYAIHENGLITLLKRDKWKTAQECFDAMIW